MSGTTKVNANQIIDRDILQQIFPNLSGQELDLLLKSIDIDLTAPLRADASVTPNLVVSFGPSIVNNTISGRQKSILSINNLLPNFTSGTVTFPSSNGGTITVSPGSNTTLTCPTNQYVKILVSLDSTGNLVVTQGTSNATEANALVPSLVSNTLPICFISLFNNAGVIQNIQQNKIFQFSAGSSSSGSAGTVATGGTGVTSFSPYDIILGGTTPTGPLQQVSGEGTFGQALLSNGPSAIPSWQTIISGLTTQSVNSTTTISNQKCYLVDTTSSPVTLNLPSPVNNLFFVVKDSGGNAAINNITIHRFASELIDGTAADKIIALAHDSLTFISNGTNWFILDEYRPPFIVATGGTITTDGNFKIHTFNSSGTFQIISGSGSVQYLIVAGGASGGANGDGGGGGAGGFITGFSTLNTGSFPIVVGAGGAANTSIASIGNNGSNSTFNGFTAIGGGSTDGNASGKTNTDDGRAGGSGGGASNETNAAAVGGSGTVGQGNNGGNNFSGTGTPPGGGGGASAVGANATSNVAGNGGIGTASAISGSSVFYAGGGGGGCGGGGTNGTGGSGGGGNGNNNGSPGVSGAANTGGGGGGTGNAGGQPGGTGGSGVVIIRYQYQ